MFEFNMNKMAIFYCFVSKFYKLGVNPLKIQNIVYLYELITKVSVSIYVHSDAAQVKLHLFKLLFEAKRLAVFK